MDRKKVWLLIGTTLGYLCIWDMRFGLLLRAWSVTAQEDRMPRAIVSLALHPTQGKGKWVVVCLGRADGAQDSLEIWDVSKCKLVETFHITGTKETGMNHGAAPSEQKQKGDSTTSGFISPAAAIESFLKNTLREQLDAPSPAIQAFHIGTEYAPSSMQSMPTTATSTTGFSSGELVPSGTSSGYLLTASDDLKLRFWNLGTIERSTVYSAREESKPGRYSTRKADSDEPIKTWIEEASTAIAPKHRSTLIANYQQQLLKAHQEPVTSFAVLSTPFPCIVSADRSGLIKVFA